MASIFYMTRTIGLGTGKGCYIERDIKEFTSRHEHFFFLLQIFPIQRAKLKDLTGLCSRRVPTAEIGKCQLDLFAPVMMWCGILKFCEGGSGREGFELRDKTSRHRIRSK